jgi:HAD superfamily phosphatase
MNHSLLVFDMDGVLVDVTESYRETIARTVEHFTGVKPTNAQIQCYKNQGGWNDDWKLSHHMVTAAGIPVEFEEVKKHFQSLFLGNGSEGLMFREQWIPKPGTLERLSRTFRIAVFTGRPRDEAQLTLDRFAPELVFNPIVGMEDVERRKPDPDGLLRILKANPGCAAFYVGDTIDDARAARAAQVPFIGIAAPSNPHGVELRALFQTEGAYAIADDVNDLEKVLAA